jgi:hypothetical protein
MFQMFYLLQTHIAFKCFMLKCFVFQRYVQRVIGHGPGAGGRGAASQGPTMDGAHGAPRVLRTGRARPRLDSWVLSARREKRRSGEGATGTGQGETDEGGVHVYGVTRQT